MRETFLPFALPDLDHTEFDQIKESLESGWITTGPKTRQFEVEFATMVGAKHAVAVNSCTAAMHLALEAIGLQRGDEVITTPYTFAATAEVIRYFDARPVFVDVDPFTLNMDISQIEAQITSQTKAIMPVDIAGLPVDYDPLLDLAQTHHLTVIEDAAHAFPTRYKGKMIGSISDMTCFSFYATKTITTGEGGMICTDNDEWANRCRIMALHGISKDAWKRYTAEGSWYYEIVAPGYKYNLTDIAAGMGLAQLKKARQMHARRVAIAQRYNNAFQHYPELQLPAPACKSSCIPSDCGCQHAWHLYLIRLNFDRLNIDRAGFVDALKQRNIGTSVHFIPLHIHPYYRERYHFQPEDFPVAYQEYQRVISLPIYSKMSDSDVDDVIEAVVTIIETHRS
ncbi:MAG: DegT/DnrJ/EryC1/StrS family aminotransferase [Gemmatimonadetes bacterium]|nr:MAG: DegT/DnrJ/EryC1/StrS family aminotransferase [Gemmatimonadota bacterium]